MPSIPTAERLRAILDYNPDTGALRWKSHAGASPSWIGRFAGKPAFTGICKDGYHIGSVDRCDMRAHRAIWIIAHGKLPDQIDHINGDRRDNRLCNLRSVSKLENGRNQSLSNRNKSGYVGVSWHNLTKKWIAHITVDRKRRHIGLFSTPELARDAYLAKANAIGFHANHGKPARPAATIDDQG
jgi:hypothetical protein